MPRPGSTIPKEPIVRLMQKAGAKRVSEGASEALVEYLTAYALKIGKHALQFANHAGRKTVQSEDVKLAAK